METNHEALKLLVMEQIKPVIEIFVDALFEKLQKEMKKQSADVVTQKDEILTFNEVLEMYKLGATTLETKIRELGIPFGQAVKKGNRRFFKSDCDKFLIKKI
jgi:hypothetical protein